MFHLPDLFTGFFDLGHTHSKCVFSPWEGTPIVVPDPDFDFPALVKERMEQEEFFTNLDAHNPFDSGSPLTMPPSSPELKASLDLTFNLPTALPASQPNTPMLDMAPPSDAPHPSHAKQQSKANGNLCTKHTHTSSPVQTEFEIEQAPHASTAYVRIHEDSWKKHHTLQDLVGPKYGFKHCAWPGSDAISIIDREGHVIVVMAEHPNDPDWDNVHTEVADKLETSRRHCKLDREHWHHRHGTFAALSNGISYGGGQMHPQNLHHSMKNTKVLSSLLNCMAFIRLAGFGSAAFATWVPSLFCYYATHLCNLLLHDATLVINWANSIFACVTFNFGPLTLCFHHMDSGNLPFGWCTITTLSKFDYHHGGHLVLWDLKLVIDFPLGSTILIPSAILHHLNTSLAHVDYGFQSSETHWASLTANQWEKATQMQEDRWQMGLDLFLTLEELQTM
ncbi:uncharacterized protein ARMOST_11709 [Armillaria ostoyae]|uniref:Uncharacterized protein n=1 Tax=Armillaria ostoyae TaxID=47428 RepID=A0A284RHW6_ARMOS|nr:uncharacterized protein ARMOST_11709 [Armillaria ostoyae]